MDMASSPSNGFDSGYLIIDFPEQPGVLEYGSIGVMQDTVEYGHPIRYYFYYANTPLLHYSIRWYNAFESFHLKFHPDV